jgi:pyruvate,orthophosphate dikinase
LETSPEDIEGMDAAEGILTARGGMTSHAAVVCRGMGKPCICGLEELEILEDDKCFKIKGQIFKQGQQISLNGSTGEVYAGKIKLVDPELNSNSFNTLMQWANQLRTLRVRTNADTPKDTEKALHFGAEGIGLIRTEHMFFKADRISTVRQMILTDNEEKKKEVLAKVQEFQK